MARSPNEPFDGDKFDNLRRELEGKLDKKLQAQFFYWACGMLGLVLIPILGYFIVQINRLDAKINEDNTKSVILDEKLKSIENRLGIRR